MGWFGFYPTAIINSLSVPVCDGRVYPLKKIIALVIFIFGKD
jgi:hypothetical protein